MSEALHKADYKPPYQHIKRGRLLFDFGKDHVDVEARVGVTRDVTNGKVGKTLKIDWQKTKVSEL